MLLNQPVYGHIAVFVLNSKFHRISIQLTRAQVLNLPRSGISASRLLSSKFRGEGRNNRAGIGGVKRCRRDKRNIKELELFPPLICMGNWRRIKAPFPSTCRSLRVQEMGLLYDANFPYK